MGGVPLFTSGKDQPMLLKKYADSFAELAAAEELNYQGMGWTDIEAIQLAKALPSCTNLKRLNLDMNLIGDVGAKALAAALPSCRNLKDLDMSGNNRLGRA